MVWTNLFMFSFYYVSSHSFCARYISGTHNPQFFYLCWWRANTRNISFCCLLRVVIWPLLTSLISYFRISLPRLSQFLKKLYPSIKYLVNLHFPSVNSNWAPQHRANTQLFALSDRVCLSGLKNKCNCTDNVLHQTVERIRKTRRARAQKLMGVASWSQEHDRYMHG